MFWEKWLPVRRVADPGEEKYPAAPGIAGQGGGVRTREIPPPFDPGVPEDLNALNPNELPKSSDKPT